LRIYIRNNVYYLDYADAQGKRVRESTETNNRDLAKQIAAKRQVEILEEKKMGYKNFPLIKFSDFKKTYLEYSEANKRYKSTRIDKMALENFGRFLNNEIIYLNDITPADIERYKIARRKNSFNDHAKFKNEVSYSTIRR
jgi:hypothetical protein